jgi:RNA polymerase sigma-70 factor (ECF subfamily)
MIGRILHIGASSPAGHAPAARTRTGARLDEPPLGPAELERFRSLMLPHLDGAYAYARFLCRDAVTAEDLTQEAYLRACRAFRGYRGGDAKAWLFAVLRSCFLSWARAPARREVASEAVGETPGAELAAEDDTPEEALLRRSESDGLRGAIQALPEPFRETLVLRELEELSYKQVAEVTGVPIGTVMSRLARARQLLVAALRKEELP